LSKAIYFYTKKKNEEKPQSILLRPAPINIILQSFLLVKNKDEGKSSLPNCLANIDLSNLPGAIRFDLDFGKYF